MKCFEKKYWALVSGDGESLIGVYNSPEHAEEKAFVEWPGRKLIPVMITQIEETHNVPSA